MWNISHENDLLVVKIPSAFRCGWETCFVRNWGVNIKPLLLKIDRCYILKEDLVQFVLPLMQKHPKGKKKANTSLRLLLDSE